MNNLISLFSHTLLFLKNMPSKLAYFIAAGLMYMMIEIGAVLHSLPLNDLSQIPVGILNGNPIAFFIVGFISIFLAQFLIFSELYEYCKEKTKRKN